MATKKNPASKSSRKVTKSGYVRSLPTSLSAKEVVESSEIVLTSLPASPDVEAAYLDPGGLVDTAKRGTILIDTTGSVIAQINGLSALNTRQGHRHTRAVVGRGELT